MITNRKGGQVYPLVDSRLKLVVVDHGDPKVPMLRTLLSMPRADLVVALDDSRDYAGALSGGSRQTKNGMGSGHQPSLRGRRLLRMDKRPSLALGSGQDRLPSGQGSASRRQARWRGRARAAGRQGTIPTARTDIAATSHRRRARGLTLLTSIARRKPVGALGNSLTNNGPGSSAAFGKPFQSTRSWFTAQPERCRNSRLTGRSLLTAKGPLQSCSQRFPQPTW